MRRWAMHKDKAHPPTVAALLAAGAMVLEVNSGHWAGPGGKLRPVGAPDLMVLFRGQWVALEVKTPNADKGGSKKRKDREAQQALFRELVSRSGATAYEVHGPLEALAALGCNDVEARHGLLAAAQHEPSMAGTPSSLGEVRAMLSEARQKLGVEQPPPVRAPRGPQPAYTPPRTDFGQCAKPGCSGRAMPSASLCPGCFLEGVGA